MIHEAINQARANGMILSNPLEGVKLPKQTKPDVRALSLEEQTTLIKTAKAWRFKWPAAFSVILALFTGLRRGEVLGLRWQDIDLNPTNPIIHVKNSLSRHMDVHGEGEGKTILQLCDTKTSNSKRDIPIFDDLYKNLISYRESQISLKASKGIAHQESDFVFQSTLFKMYEPRRFYLKYTELLNAAGIVNADFHTLRHTFATRALESGMDVYVLSRLLGHAQASTTLNRYCHALPNHKKSSMEKLSNLFSAGA